MYIDAGIVLRFSSASMVLVKFINTRKFDTVTTKALSIVAIASLRKSWSNTPIQPFATAGSAHIQQAATVRTFTSPAKKTFQYSFIMSKRTSYERSELGHPSTKRAKQIDENLPFDNLTKLLDDQEENKEVTKVAHWFRPKDLRIHDNTALHHASSLAQSSKKPLLCIYLHCPAEESWHGTSPARMDFMIEGLRSMQKELKELDIPLVFLQSDDRKDHVSTVVKFLRDNSVSHVFANFEYEVDEISRDIGLLQEVGDKVQVSMYHDQTVVEPGTMLTGNGKPMKVFSPYHRAWLGKIKEEPNLLDTHPAPAKNEASIANEIKSLFDSKLPKVTEDKHFASEDDKKRIRKLWPAGHAAGMKRMDSFLSQIDDYAATRSNPAANSTSRMSAYFSAGMVSVREALSRVRKYNEGSSDFSESGSSHGVYSWVREIVFRELYRQTLMTTPHTAMNLPQNLKFDFVKWEDDEEGWEKWYKVIARHPITQDDRLKVPTGNDWRAIH